MEAKLREYWAMPRNRILLLIFIGLLLGFYSIILSKVEVESPVVGEVPSGAALAPKVGQSVEKEKEAVQVIGANQQSAIKDPFIAPFTAPPENVRKIAKQNRGVSPMLDVKPLGKRAKQKPSLVLPKLTGIISINNQKIALMEYGEESKQCGVDGKIGPYQVVQVHRNVTLVGPEGTIILEVGQ